MLTYIPSMFANLSRKDDEEEIRMYPGCTLVGLNLDRIRGIIECAGEPNVVSDSTQQDLYVKSIEQVIDYFPEIVNASGISRHFLEYSMMQHTSPQVLRKLLELFPVSDEIDLVVALSKAPSDALRQVVMDYIEKQEGQECQGQQASGCAWFGCSNGSAAETNLKACARCKKTKYCSKACQINDWKMHKLSCFSPDVKRHLVKETTLEAISATANAAQPGDVIEIPSGTYISKSGARLIYISKPLSIIGDGMDKVNVVGDFLFKEEANVDGTMSVQRLTINGSVKVCDTTSCNITFSSVMVKCPPELTAAGSDAFELRNCRGKVLLTCCEIVGGSDGLVLSGSPNVHIRETDIQHAQSRGIFADDYFVIEDSAVYSCGSYGIKGRAGWDERGDNQIQPGPW